MKDDEQQVVANKDGTLEEVVAYWINELLKLDAKLKADEKARNDLARKRYWAKR